MGVFDSAGSDYLHYIGVDDSYPGWSDFSREMDIEMLYLVEELVAERKREDPELRISADHRCVMWEWIDTPAGQLPNGTIFEYKGWQGTVRPPTAHEIEWRIDYEEPYIYARWIPINQLNPYVAPPRWPNSTPRVNPYEVVLARLPVPLDRGQLLALIDGTHTPTAITPRPGRTQYLTDREARIATLALSNVNLMHADLAEHLGISTSAASNTLHRAYKKLGVGSRAELTQELIDKARPPSKR